MSDTIVGSIPDTAWVEFDVLADGYCVPREEMRKVVVSVAKSVVKDMFNRAIIDARLHAVREVYMGGCKQPGCLACELIGGNGNADS